MVISVNRAALTEFVCSLYGKFSVSPAPRPNPAVRVYAAAYDRWATFFDWKLWEYWHRSLTYASMLIRPIKADCRITER